MKDRAVDWLWRHFICMVTVLSLLLYAFTYLEDCFGPPIRADGAGYYMYLPAYLIHGDPTFTKVAECQYGGAIPLWSGVSLNPDTGRYFNKYNAGVAVMMSPFFAAAHLATWWLRSPPGGFEWWKLNHPMDGYSILYQHAAGLAGLFYMICGVAILKRALSEHFSPGVVLVTLGALLFGTNLLHYGTGETVFSSPYSFFLFSAFLFLAQRWYGPPGFPGLSVLLGLVAGLIALVRLNNALFLIVFPLWGVVEVEDLRARWRFWRGRTASLLVMAATAALVFAPQMLIWKFSGGRWLAYSYGTESFRWLRPHVAEVLFSLNRGLLFWSPILLLGFLGLPAARKRAPGCVLPALVYLPLHVYLVASWHQWWWGGSFGHRAFIEDYALLAFPLAAFYGALASRWGKWVVGLVTLGGITWSIFFMKLYYTRELSYYGLDGQALFDIFWLRKEALLAAFRRMLAP